MTSVTSMASVTSVPVTPCAVAELGQSDSCHMRKLYLDICGMVLDMFSKQFFKQYFFMTTLTLVGEWMSSYR